MIVDLWLLVVTLVPSTLTTCRSDNGANLLTFDLRYESPPKTCSLLLLRGSLEPSCVEAVDVCRYRLGDDDALALSSRGL